MRIQEIIRKIISVTRVVTENAYDIRAYDIMTLGVQKDAGAYFSKKQNASFSNFVIL